VETASETQAPTVVCLFGDKIDPSLYQELCQVDTTHVAGPHVGKKYVPKNQTLERTHFAFAIKACREIGGYTTLGDMARRYPALKTSARCAVFASDMQDVLIDDCHAASRITDWVANGGQHVEKAKDRKPRKKVNEPEVVENGDGI
jgi:hypothetical protein